MTLYVGELGTRFWSKVGPVDGNGCMEWTGSRSPKGYGTYWYEGGCRFAHRLALAESLGRPLGDDELACHRCDNPPCCNPAHLYAGTASDNMRDMAARGRAFYLRTSRAPGRSGHRGVAWHAQTGKWQAYIDDHGRRRSLGLFHDLDDAVAARQAAEREVFG